MAILCALCSGTADAATTTVCLELDIGEYGTDTSVTTVALGSNEWGEDFGRRTIEASGGLLTEHEFKAQRWLARVVDEASGDPLWGFAPLDGNGCAADVTYDAPTTLRVEFVRWAVYGDGRHLVAYDCNDKAADKCKFGLPGDDVEVQGGTMPVTGLVPAPGATTYALVEAYHPNPPTALPPADHILWAASFADETQPTGWSSYAGPLSPEWEVVYLGHDDGDVRVLGTGVSHVSRDLGGEPTLNVLGPSDYRRKFTVAHEFGHIQTTVIPGMPIDAADYTQDGLPPAHDFDSPEWQAAASIEGFANAYSAWVWNDHAVVSASYPNFPVSTQVPILCANPADCPDPLCGASVVCGPGVSTELDWTEALWDFQRNASISTAETCRLLSGVYGNGMGWLGSPCMASCNTDAFWLNFDAKVQNLLSPADYAVWQDRAAAWNIDR